MKTLKFMQIIFIIRWIARIIGFFLLTFFIWFALRIGGPDFSIMNNQEFGLFISNMVMLIGLIITWRWEFIGSMLLIGGFISFSIINNAFWIGPLFPAFFLVGLLHLICWGGTHKHCMNLEIFNCRCFFK